MGQPRVLILGGSGTFGLLLAREVLTTTDSFVVLAGRNGRRLERALRRLHSPLRTECIQVDLNRPESLGLGARYADAVVCAAGPFQQLPRELVGVAIGAGSHWLDIADDPGWIRDVRNDLALSQRARSSGLLVATGLSTTPAVSSALMKVCLERLPTARSARVVLFAGNRNKKGPAVLQSALMGGLRSSYRVELLELGWRVGYELPSADSVGVGVERGIETRFLVAPESRLGGGLLHLAGVVGAGGARVSRVAAALARPLSIFGTAAGSIEARVVDATWTCTAAIVGDQRLAILPCAIVLDRLCSTDQAHQEPAVDRAGAFLEEPAELLCALVHRGMRLLGPHMTRHR